MFIYWIKNNEIESGPHPFPSVIDRNGINISNPKEADIISAGGLIEPERPITTDQQRLEIDFIDGVLIWKILEKETYIPKVVSMRQARVYLSRVGLLDTVTDQINTIGGEALITWEYSQEVQRDNPLVASMGFTEEQLDTMFLEASQL